eukprot:5475032-Prymnesium_polylepis.1
MSIGARERGRLAPRQKLLAPPPRGSDARTGSVHAYLPAARAVSRAQARRGCASRYTVDTV